MRTSLPEGWTIDRLQELEPGARVEDASALLAFDVTVRPHIPLSPEFAISFGGQYLIRAAGSPDWWMGQRDKASGDILCWGTYGTDLAGAIRAL